MKCKICSTENKSIFTSTILNKYNIKYYHCSCCGFLQTEEPYWLEEAYQESINMSDTGYMQRNITLSKQISLLCYLCFNKDAKYVDYAGGYGVFVRLMRDIGFDFYWSDTFTKNIFVRGFEYNKVDTIEAITSFESFEHFVNPIEEIKSLLKTSRNIIFTTKVLPDSIPKPEEWWYYGLDHGQHISFYSKKTFKYIAEKYNLEYVNMGDLHILTNNPISKFKINIMKLGKYGLYKYVEIKHKSKTFEDYKIVR